MLEYTCYGLDCLIVGFKVHTSCRDMGRGGPMEIFFDKGRCCG